MCKFSFMVCYMASHLSSHFSAENYTVSTSLNHALHARSSGTTDYSHRWRKVRGTWYFRRPLKRTLGRKLLLVWATLMWLECAVSYLSARLCHVHCFSLMDGPHCQQHPQPSVRCGVHVDGVVQQRGIYPGAWEQHVIVGTPMELLEKPHTTMNSFFFVFSSLQRD